MPLRHSVPVALPLLIQVASEEDCKNMNVWSFTYTTANSRFLFLWGFFLLWAAVVFHCNYRFTLTEPTTHRILKRISVTSGHLKSLRPHRRIHYRLWPFLSDCMLYGDGTVAVWFFLFTTGRKESPGLINMTTCKLTVLLPQRGWSNPVPHLW